MFLSLTQPFDSRDILDVDHWIGAFLEKIQRVAQKVPLNPRLQGRLRAMKIEVRVLLDLPHDSDEKSGEAMETVSEFIIRTIGCSTLR
jgi:hypothetical protein